MQNSWIHFLEVDRFVIKYNLFTTGIFINVQLDLSQLKFIAQIRCS